VPLFTPLSISLSFSYVPCIHFISFSPLLVIESVIVVSSRAVFVNREHQWDSQVHRLSSEEFHYWSLLRQGPLRLHRYFSGIIKFILEDITSSFPTAISYYSCYLKPSFPSLSSVISEIGRSTDECHCRQCVNCC